MAIDKLSGAAINIRRANKKSFLKPTNGQPNSSSLPQSKGSKQHPISKGATSSAGDLEVGFFGFKTLPTFISNAVQRVLDGVHERRPAGALRLSCNFYFFTKQTTKKDEAIASRSRKGVLVYIYKPTYLGVPILCP